MQNKLNCKSAKAICQHEGLYLSYLFCAFDNEKEHPNSMLGKFKPSKRVVYYELSILFIVAFIYKNT